MKVAGIGAIRKELAFLPPKELSEFCEQLILFQKNNKELATYYIFYKHDEVGYRTDLKHWLDEEFATMFNNYYYLLKSIKKTSKLLTLRLKCSGNKQTETELLLHFMLHIHTVLGVYSKYKAVESVFVSHVKKAKRAIAKLHEDSQSMYLDELEELTNNMGLSLQDL